MEPHRLDRREARRIAVRAQLLDAARPTDVVDLVNGLTLLQIDPTAAVAPNADLVAWSRIGSSYKPSDLVHALEHDRTLFELDALIRPMHELELFRAEMSTWPEWPRMREWLTQNQAFRLDILRQLNDSTVPLRSRDIADTSVVPWQSSGWTHNKSVGKMLECLAMRGEIAISARIGRERLWTIADRVFATQNGSARNGSAPTAEAAQLARNERRLTALGIAREKSTKMPLEPIDVGLAGEAAVVEGVPGLWRVDPAALGQPFVGRTALLSPFDRLIYDRVRAQQLFDFEYVLEMYKPKEKRRWGYFALPILHGDSLVGKLDAIADRTSGVLQVNAIHEDVPFTPAVHEAVEQEIVELAQWLGLNVRTSA